MNSDSKIYVAGHRGLVGSAIVRRLQAEGFEQIVSRSSSELDLTDQQAVRDFFESERPSHVVLAAAKVGGIHANDSYPADFIYLNMMIEANVIDSAYRVGVERLLFLGSSCIYPRLAPQPMPENALLTGALEPTNEPYAIAKIAGIKLCESYNRQFETDFRSVMPTNLYGPNDNFHPSNSHVIPALLRRFHEARMASSKSVAVWGSGTPRREFLHVDDLADACLHVLRLEKEAYGAATAPMQSHINVGTGEDVAIGELAEMIREVVGFEGDIKFDIAKPDGAPRKLLDVSVLNGLGWRARIGLREGLEESYRHFSRYYDQASERGIKAGS